MEIDVQEDDEVLEDMDARFDASSTAAKQDFMEDAGFPIPESGTDTTIGGAWLCGGSPKPPQVPTAPAEKQKRIELFFQPRTTTDSDEAVEHDWVNYASWQRDDRRFSATKMFHAIRRRHSRRVELHMG